MSILLQGAGFKKRLMPILLSVALAGCSNLFGSSFTETLQRDANASSEFYMNKLEQTQNVEDKETYKLFAARAFIVENKIAQSEAILSELGELNDAQKLDRTLIEARLSAAKGANEVAESQLRLIDLNKLSVSQKSRYYETQATVFENRKDMIEAVKARIKMDENLTDVQRRQNNVDKTWALLRAANTGVINNAPDDGNVALGGWLTLIKAYNDNIRQPVQLSQALQNWKNAYPNHAAATLFPKELQSLLNFQQTNLAQIGLVLPISGDGQILGNTILSGFNDAKGNSTIPVQIFDSAIYSIDEITAQAKEAGVKALVGPLLKQNVESIINNPVSVQGMDVLALNATPNARAINQICYYGLSPEDEAESAATKMWNDGVRSPVVAMPQNELGQRVGNAFNVRWQQLASTDANIRYYNLPADVPYFLQENASNSTALYAVASPDELAEIKGYLANSAPNLKIYASSRSNSASNSAEYVTQMNGVQFSDIPFFKEATSAQYQKVAGSTGGEYQLMRLYAMGADAWLLINHFNELRQVPGYQLSGLTGILSAGPNCNVERDMTWFQYQDSNIVPVAN
ncbi:penicillin-binding protein activator [Rodentibacter pneumotropicus]|uniref:penicillin-binding protein activator n=1 Tax=Rodentibacter pneumotropicus TaxID=758 RepID=UPI0009895692|nr:penicillin-binding protein activator [Rodentibacter pneumotropicus]NBH75713.1 penicillin-binding protein activator [Rodentibacter pneumotropicus]OOF60979.1 penicillin-binding protein [Rodentibacter pneumotropicus]THA04201.1 penicillin-binding protein activator [Rodentibacter pneumotropicus]THA05429.1 penicillin-binding protein activator [Rodentibacter pneumotropicus]THA12436.1 penicillin-binding protein activator [Rodentibacter pneumotropicus]